MCLYFHETSQPANGPNVALVGQQFMQGKHAPGRGVQPGRGAPPPGGPTLHPPVPAKMTPVIQGSMPNARKVGGPPPVVAPGRGGAGRGGMNSFPGRGHPPPQMQNKGGRGPGGPMQQQLGPGKPQMAGRGLPPPQQINGQQGAPGLLPPAQQKQMQQQQQFQHQQKQQQLQQQQQQQQQQMLHQQSQQQQQLKQQQQVQMQQHHQQQQQQPQPPVSEQRAVEFDHAIMYVTNIKKRFASDPRTYHTFLEILHTYQKEQRGIKEVLEQVSSLFADHPDLLKEFTFFLPDAVQEQAKERLHRAAAEAEAKQRAAVEAAAKQQEAEQIAAQTPKAAPTGWRAPSKPTSTPKQTTSTPKQVQSSADTQQLIDMTQPEEVSFFALCTWSLFFFYYCIILTLFL